MIPHLAPQPVFTGSLVWAGFVFRGGLMQLAKNRGIAMRGIVSTPG